MDKSAIIAYNLITIAESLKEDSSDFGRLCVAELLRLADASLSELPLLQQGAIKQMVILVQTINTSEDEGEKLRALEALKDLLNSQETHDAINGYGAVLIGSIITALDKSLSMFGPNHEIHKLKTEIENTLHSIIS